MKAVMISCKQRAETERPWTLAQFENIGVDVEVQESSCNPAGGVMNRHAAWHAIKKGWDDGEGVLFMEDDIDVNGYTFHQALDMAIDADHITDFCVMRDYLYPDEVYGQLRTTGKAKLGIYDMPNFKAEKGFYGTQCVWIPRWFIHDEIIPNQQDFVTEDEEPARHVGEAWRGFDFWLKEHAPHIMLVVPNPIDHRNAVTMSKITKDVKGKARPRHPFEARSLTFYHRTVLPKKES